MLNKLLKRCMPWMDKGRWHSIRIAGSGPNDLRAIFNSDEILSVAISTVGNVSMTVTMKHVPYIIDYKFCPDVGQEFSYLSNVFITYKTDLSFDVSIGMTGTFWFFMR